MATFQSLSQELVDEILGFLRDDVDALRSCSFLHRPFTPACQKELFSTIAVVVDAVAGHDILAIPSTQKLLALMESSPHIAKYVKSLKIIGGLGHKSPSDDHRLALILPLFHRLTAFAANARSPEFPPASFKHLAYSKFNDSCVLKTRADQNPEQPTELVSLDLGNPYWKSRKLFDAISSSTIIDVSQLRRLYLNVAEMPLFAHGLAEQILQACSNTLEVLKLDPSSVVNRKTEEEIYLETRNGNQTHLFDIGSLSALRNLQIRLRIDYSGDIGRYHEPDVVLSPYPSFLHMLKTIPITNRLEELTILNVYNSPLKSLPDEIEFVPWDKLVPLLSERFLYLRKVKFLLQLSPDMWALRMIINAAHPMAVNFQRSGMLEILEVRGKLDIDLRKEHLFRCNCANSVGRTSRRIVVSYVCIASRFSLILEFFVNEERRRWRVILSY
ncbi:hypothetical protein BDZ97DRAFT_1790844 [Flammula alnicola]|nr:hypothetical protein BDZ97DRAFT_1790844 [Flammula alnicola]